MVTFVCGTLLIHQGLGKKAAMAGAGLLAIMPYFITSARFGLESYLLTGTSALMLCLLVFAVRRKSTALFAAAGVAMGLCLYAYAVSYVILPLFLLLFLAYLLYLKQLRLRHLLALGIPLALMAWPLIALVVVNQLNLPTLTLGPITIPNLPNYRGGEFSFSNIPGNFIAMLYTLFARDNLPFNAFKGHYTLYLISLPFALVGFVKGAVESVKAVRSRQFSVSATLLLFFACAFLQGLLLGDSGPNVNKINAAYLACAYFITLGIATAVKALPFRRVAAGLVATAYLASFGLFAHHYFVRYPKEVYPQYLFYPSMQPLTQWLQTHNPENLPVYFTADHFSSIYFCLAAGISPYDANFAENGIATEAEGTYFFYSYTPQEGTPPPKALHVVWECHPDMAENLQNAGYTLLYDGTYKVYG